ncbi:M23 family metallopeptidase [Paenibacillus sp. 481]|nr:M23 family metallopeptidase [Paenibacillus sp. 481]
MNEEMGSVYALSSQMKERMTQVTVLEKQLKTFIYSSGQPQQQKKTDASPKSTARNLSSHDANIAQAKQLHLTSVGGEFIQPTQDNTHNHNGTSAHTQSSSTTIDSDKVAQQWSQTFAQLEHMDATWKQWDKSMPPLIAKAERMQQQLDGTPNFWPTTAYRVTSQFGLRDDPFNRSQAHHGGLDVAGHNGEPIFAAAEGTVTASSRDNQKGNYIFIRHRGNLETRYLHLSESQVKTGSKVRKGQQIGKLGSTGRSTGPHLHFEIRQNGEPIDPLNYVSSPNTPNQK